MAEGFDPADAPVARGRRDPNLQIALQNDAMLVDAGESEPEQTFIGLATGDVVMAKVTHAVTRTDGGDSWYSYGVQTHILDGENEEDAYMRVATIVNERVLDLGDDADNRIAELMAAQQRVPAPRGRR